jgi:hypothetical protein
MTPRPKEATQWSQIVMQTGALTGVAASNSTGTVFSLRQIDSASVLMIQRIGIMWVTTTGYTAAQYQDFGFSVARSFSVSDSGGTAWSGVSDNNSFRTSFPGFTNIDMRIATTAALTAGTRTVDSNFMGLAGCNNLAATAGGTIPLTWVFDQIPGEYPLILAQNEGIVMWPGVAMGAAGVGTLTVVIEMAQATAFA